MLSLYLDLSQCAGIAVSCPWLLKFFHFPFEHSLTLWEENAKLPNPFLRLSFTPVERAMCKI